MKRILSIIIMIYGLLCSVMAYSPGEYGSSMGVRTTEYRRIGYTTNYSNGQFNSGVYKSSMTTLENQNRAFTGTYTPAASSSGGSRPGGGPRRSPERPFSGNWLEDFEDWCRMHNVPIIGRVLGYDEDWPSYVDSEYWEQFLKEHSEYYDEVWDYYQAHPETPNNPFKTPVGDAVVPLFSLIVLYVGYNMLSNKWRIREV